MEDQNLAKLLYEFALLPENREEMDFVAGQNHWALFLESLGQELELSGCGAAVEAYLYSRPYEQACGFCVGCGYFLVSCGDRGECFLEILEVDEEEARNRFLEWIIHKRAYEWALKSEEREKARWAYRCRYDCRLPWFKKALEWLAPVVDWGFFAQCAERYIALLNRWFARPHWEYDYQISRIIEISDSKEYEDPQYLYRIEPDEVPGHSRISLILQKPQPGGERAAYEFSVAGEALDMKRFDETVLVLMEGKEDNVNAYSLEGEFLWNIGEKLQGRRHYEEIDPLWEEICE